jgi:hypothetical protein
MRTETGAFPRNNSGCLVSSPLHVAATVGNTFDWNSPNEGSGSPSEFLSAELQSPEDPIAVVGHSYGGDRAREFARYIRNSQSLLPDALVTIDPIDTIECTPDIKQHFAECVTYPAFDACDQSKRKVPVPQIPHIVDFVQRSRSVPNRCIQGYDLANTNSTVVPNQSHEKIDNDELNVHTPISQLLTTLVSTKPRQFRGFAY